MIWTDELLTHLTQTLNEIEKNLGSEGRIICQKELAEITAAIAKISHAISKKTITNLVNTIKNINARIESEVLALENEMHGVEGYSDYEYERMKNCEWKIILRNELEKMLASIREFEKQSTHPV
jgi:hypothetical protein